MNSFPKCHFELYANLLKIMPDERIMQEDFKFKFKFIMKRA